MTVHVTVPGTAVLNTAASAMLSFVITLLSMSSSPPEFLIANWLNSIRCSSSNYSHNRQYISQRFYVYLKFVLLPEDGAPVDVARVVFVHRLCPAFGREDSLVSVALELGTESADEFTCFYFL